MPRRYQRIKWPDPDSYLGPDPANPAEEWRRCAGYEGLYVISSLGRIMRVAPGANGGGASPGRILRIQRLRTGRGDEMVERVVLSSAKGGRRLHSVSRLVCESFHGPPPYGPASCASHKDGNTLNNRADNLEWTHAEVARERSAIGAARAGTAPQMLTAEQVEAIQTAPVETTNAQLAAQLGVTERTVEGYRGPRRGWINAIASGGELLTTAQASSRLGISADRIKQLIYAGRVPGAHKIGPDWLVPAEWVRAYKPTPGAKRGPKPKC